MFFGVGIVVFLRLKNLSLKIFSIHLLSPFVISHRRKLRLYALNPTITLTPSPPSTPRPSMNNPLLPPEFQPLLRDYLDPDSPNFLELDSNKIIQNVVADAVGAPVSPEIVESFKRSLSYYSRIKDNQILRVREIFFDLFDLFDLFLKFCFLFFREENGMQVLGNI